MRERRSIDLDLAMRLGAAFGQGAHFWLGLQIQYDLWQARNRESLVRPIRMPQWLDGRGKRAGAALRHNVGAL